MNHEDRFWRQFEGQTASSELDADHWVRVYTELQSTLEMMAAGGAGDTTRIDALLRVFGERLRFWQRVQHDAPVRAARNGGRRRSGGGRSRSA